jgi:hypothetical protein
MKTITVLDIEAPKKMNFIQRGYFEQLRQLLPFTLTVEDDDDKEG